MNKIFKAIALLCVAVHNIAAQEKMQVTGLEMPVEILVDKWGVPHIYAQTEADLFFAQGFYAARDRLFQMEIWRRQATGTVAEILGVRELDRDIGTRLFQFRGDIQAEMNHYHPRGELIITSFVKGVNAFIELTETDSSLLSMEFKLLGIKPQKWTAEVVVSRHQGLLGNIDRELSIGRAVALIGQDKVREIENFQPKQPLLDLDSKISTDGLFEDILQVYHAFRKPIKFEPEDLLTAYAATDLQQFYARQKEDEKAWELVQRRENNTIGSNNWVVSGNLTESGYPMMANDPHRAHSAPSLRYMSHLVGPGWNVIGAGEPEIPGISIGHNEYGAWGLTIFATDAEDLYVYDTNPDNPDAYLYKSAWENMRIIEEEINVKGKLPKQVKLKYTRHGPVVYEDVKKHKAYAVRCGWLEVGGSPYLASLRMNQAQNWEEFREACHYAHIPGENMVWADRQGNIGWQAVGIAPIRRNFSGMVPVPGDGTYEWDGYLPIKAKPSVLNPAEGFFVSANEQLTPQGYPHFEAIGFDWSDPFRGNRIRDYLASGRNFNLMDHANLQTDYLSLPAKNIVPLLKSLHSDGPLTEQARKLLLQWDYRMDKNSAAAAVYNEWERHIVNALEQKMIPAKASKYLSLSLSKIIDILLLPQDQFGADPIRGRDRFLLDNLKLAVLKLSNEKGTVTTAWEYGKIKQVLIKHPLSNAVSDEIRQKLDVGPLPRGGNGSTVNNTGNGNNQTHGASFRLIVDTQDWDKCLGINTPGQSGNPEHPNYQDLFQLWADDKYFPVFFTRSKIERVKNNTLVLEGKNE